ncbi:MAG: amidohydrolase family protein [Microscillaceae bacterium]|nr:amidohydrolase family protein [Microscillaceae bacterium]
MIIDAHQHFWQYSPERHAWITEEMSVIRRDFMPEDLQAAWQNHLVEGCVAVQADQSEEETLFLLDLAEKNDFIKAVVGWVDLRSEQLEERLEYFAQFHKLRGFRHIVQNEPEDNFMLREDFQRGLSLLKKYNFTYDILIYPHQMQAALQTVQNFPEQPFVLDHIAKPYIKERKITQWDDYIHAMASQENVYCKISGLVTEADWQYWTYLDFVPYLDVVWDAFGADRVMFGSDWPVCLLAGTYTEVLEILQTYTQHLSEAEKTKIFSGNAKRFYGNN